MTRERGEKERGEHDADTKRQHEERGEESSDDKDLKSREYKDKQGNVHHHTKKYEEQHR